MLQVRELDHGQIQVLTLVGSFAHETATGIQARIMGAQDMSISHIILDFSQVTDIDSTNLYELFLWYHNLRPQHAKITVVKPQPYIRYHVDWAPLEEIVSIYSSEQDALDDVEESSRDQDPPSELSL